MSETQLILHVKGTESQTTSLSKHEVRDAISQGKISHSQLIWSPNDNAWKQARELPDLVPPVEHLILHVKGTEAQTEELPRPAVRVAIAEGKITHSQLIWSPRDNAWKQVRELPDLLPSQKLAPAPGRAKPVAPAEIVIPESPNNPVARAVAATGTPKVRVAVPGVATPKVMKAAVPVAAARPANARPVDSIHDFTVPEEDDSSNPFKWIFIGLAALIILVLAGNYLFVDQPLVSALRQTPYDKASVYAHFGAFMQPNVIVIHIAPSASVTPDRLADFLVVLANSTPPSPTSDLFGRVALTTGWTAQYTFSGFAWKQLSDMRHQSAAERKEFLMDQMCDAGGQPLAPPSTLNQADREAQSEKIWTDFVAYFTATH